MHCRVASQDCTIQVRAPPGRERVKILVGGRPVSSGFFREDKLISEISVGEKYCHNSSNKFAFEELPNLELLKIMGWFK